MKSIYIQPFITDAQKSWVTSELAILPHHLQSIYINGLKTLETFQHKPLDFHIDVKVLPRTALCNKFILHFCIKCIWNVQIVKFSTKRSFPWNLDFKNHEPLSLSVSTCDHKSFMSIHATKTDNPFLPVFIPGKSL